MSRRELPDHVPVGLYRSTPDGRFLDVNQPFAEILGYPDRESVLAVPVARMWTDPEERTRFIARLQREGFVRGFEMRIRRNDGSVIWVRDTVRVDRDPAGGVSFEGAIEDVSERIRAEERLRESEGRYRSLVELSPLPIAVHSAGRFVYVNPAAARLVGASSAAELIGRPVLDLVHPDSRPQVTARVRRSYEERLPAELVEETFLTLDGRPIAVEATSQPIEFDGEPATQVIIRDISARKQAERSLRESEARLRLVVGAAPVALWATDLEGRVTFAAGRAFERLGAAPERVVGLDLFDLYASHPAIVDNLRRALAGEEFNATVDVPGMVFESRYAPLRDASGAPAGMIGVGIDVSEEHRLVAEERKLAAIVEQSSDFIGVASPDRRVLYVNGAGRRLVGLDTLAEATARQIRDFFVETDAAEIEGRVMPEIVRSGSLEFELSLRHFVTGEAIPAHFRAFVIRHWTTGEPLALATIATDMRERRRIAEELRLARDAALESSRLKSAFIANMSHEIRTPLNIILGYNQIVAAHLESNGDRSQDELLAGIERASRRLTETVHGVLDISKIETGGFAVDPAPVDLGALIARRVRDAAEVAAAKGLRVSSDVAAEAKVWFDEYCLSQALANLIANAIKFTERGRVTVRLARDGDGELVLGVADTGVGIDEAYRGRLFEPFSQAEPGHTRRFEGAGLGLALARRYVEMNGARISVDSRTGEGTTVAIHFPRGLEVSSGAPPAPARARG